MTSFCNPELRTIVSYYEIYVTNPSPCLDLTEVSLTTSRQHQSSSDGTSATEEFWDEDIWTSQDEQDTIRMLEANKERCRIVSSTRESEASAWNRFYRQHQTNFFKDRHYLANTFPDEFVKGGSWVELGCGVGNSLLPLLEDPRWIVYGVDVSHIALDLLQKDPRYDPERASCAVANLSVPDPLPFQSVGTVASMMFCLSAIEAVQHPVAAKHAFDVLQPGGVLVLRDYGRFDQAQLQLACQRNKLLSDNCYRKHDGTLCYYFTLQDLEELFVTTLGMRVLELRYLKRMYRNRSSGDIRRRVWVQARFQKPV